MSDESGSGEPSGTADGAGEPGAADGTAVPAGSAETTDEAPASTSSAETTADATESDDDDDMMAPGLSDDGILLLFAGMACLLAASTAYTTGQPQPITVFAVLAGVPAAVAFVADVLSEFTPGTGLELLVGGAALVGGVFAVPGRHYANVATLLVAAALIIWRVVDVEFRDAER